MAKVLVSEKIKRKFDSEHADLEDPPAKKQFAAELIKQGLGKFRDSDPPGKPVRTIPAANGNKVIEYDDEGIKRELQQFKAKNSYDRLTTAVRACLYSGLKVPIKEWED